MKANLSKAILLPLSKLKKNGPTRDETVYVVDTLLYKSIVSHLGWNRNQKKGLEINRPGCPSPLKSEQFSAFSGRFQQLL